MIEVRFKIWSVERFERPAGAVAFPYELHGVTLQYEAVFKGNFSMQMVIYNPMNRPIVTRSIPFVAPDQDNAFTARSEAKFGLRIDRPGRYSVVAEHDGKRFAETSFHVRQFPSISSSD